MNIISLEATARESGKKAARAARRNKDVPCVLYGHNYEPVVFQVPELSLHQLIYTTEFHRIAIKIDGKSLDCVLKNVDFHPVTDRPFHADFQALLEGQAMTMTIPIHIEGIAPGLLEGGEVQELMHEIEISCLPKDIPDHVVVNIDTLSIGDSIYIGDLELEGVTFLAPAELPVVAVKAPRAEEELEEEDDIIEEVAEDTEE